MVFQGKVLEDNGKTLADYRGQKGCTLFLMILKLSGGKQIFVKSLAGKSISLDVEPNSMKMLKRRFKKRRVSLLISKDWFLQKQLEDGRLYFPFYPLSQLNQPEKFSYFLNIAFRIL